MEAVFYPNTDWTSLWYKDPARTQMEISISHPAHMFVVSAYKGKGFIVYYLYRWFSYLDLSL